MIRTWLSSFIKKNKEKILKVLKGLGIIILISSAAGILFSQMLKNETEMADNNKIYIPNKTVISGENIKQEEFIQQDNLIKTFVDYCNEQKFEEAYNLLSSECKQKEFPTFQKFKSNYCDLIFSTQKNYNMQSWVNEGNYSTYRVKFTEDFISTGDYNSAQKYEDYITIVTHKENNDRKLNVNGYIKTNIIEKETQTKELKIKVLAEDIYMDYVVYSINVKNNSNSSILLDTLQENTTLRLIGNNDAAYRLSQLNLKESDLKINTSSSKNIKLTFNKQYGSQIKGKAIQLTKVVMDYTLYKENYEQYENFKNITINL